MSKVYQAATNGNKSAKPRGFASLTPERLKEIASKGGKSVKPENRTYYRDTDYAQECGRKGGLVKKKKDS